MRIFRSVLEAVKAGYQIYDRTPEGYLVRTLVDSTHWGLALVVLQRK